MAQIKDTLTDRNPWWRGRFAAEYKEREIYGKVKKFLPLPQIIAFTGLRRVGKTTLMYKIVEDAIRNGTDPRNIIYFPFDEFTKTEIRAVIKTYEELMEKNIGEGTYLILLDEIQKLENWENQLKAFYDTFKANSKIVISGSESLFIRKKSKETLAGRMFEFKVESLSFREYLGFRGVEWEPIGIHEKELMKSLDEYTFTMGFPELVGIKDKDVIRKYVKEGIVDKVIYQDLPKIFEIEDVSKLESLLNIFMEDPGQIVEMNDLGKELGIVRQTLSNYIGYLEKAFLLQKVYNYSKNRRKVERKLKKYYPAVVSVDLLFRDDTHSRSKIFEWLIVKQLNAEFFWRNPQKDEVDMVLEDGTPAEIKYGKLELKGLIKFMKQFGVSRGYIVSYEKEGEQSVDGRKISIVPAYKFLLKDEKD
jgi:predicted AAA+ superfamily ATPase